MAALSDRPVRDVVELRKIRPADMSELLTEEIADWRSRLHWDFSPSADLVRRFVGMQALNGFALVEGGEVLGYTYYVVEDQKGLIDDLYMRAPYRDIESENLLLDTALRSMIRMSQVRRVESQLLMLSSPLHRSVPLDSYLRVYDRSFMVTDIAGLDSLPPGKAGRTALIENWSDRRQDEASAVITQAYEHHIDSEINDQYRTRDGARRFLMNIVQYPGCGAFFQPASFLAVVPDTGRLCGVSLCSLVAPDIGHVTQICVIPQMKSTGVGYEMLRRSLQSLAKHGCRKVSLTVTTANKEAVRLYERVGFNTELHFGAYVWDNFRNARKRA